MGKKKNIIVIVCVSVAFVVLSALVCFRLFGGFNAREYVDAVCMQMLKGDTEGAVKMTRGLTEEEAQRQYEEMVSHFVDNVIANGLNLEKAQKDKCEEVAKKIFSKLEYEVTEATKVSDGKYLVTIAYKKTDVMVKIQELAKQESEKANEKVNRGEYRGTTEEIQLQMQKEFAQKLPEILEEAYKTTKNGKQATMTLTVEKNENGLYTVDIGKFLIKIMDLSTKED